MRATAPPTHSLWDGGAVPFSWFSGRNIAHNCHRVSISRNVDHLTKRRQTMTSQDVQTDHAATPTGGTGPAFNVLNPAYSRGADRTGSKDCSGAFQAALNALAAYGGGTLYIPAGNYQLTNGVTWNGSAPLRISGDGPQASNIRCAGTSASITYLSITNT